MTYPSILGANGPYPPLGLLHLATRVKNNFPDCEVKIIDGQLFSLEDIIGQAGRFWPDFVGISPLNNTYLNALEIGRFVKTLGALVVFGGSHASGLAKEILSNRGPRSKDYCVDAVVKGDGEESICDFVSGKEFAEIPNLVWQNNIGTVIENDNKNFDIAKLDLVNMKFVETEVYFQKQQEPGRPNRFKRGVLMISQKGCAWRTRSGGCIFCSRMNKRISTKTPIMFWKEVLHLIEQCQPDMIFDVKDDFLENEKWLEELVSSRPDISRLKNLKIRGYARIDRVNSQIISLLAKLGLPLRFLVGFESGSDSSLKTMNKGFSIRQALAGVQMLKRMGAGISACFVLGAPGENKKSLLETLKFAEKIKKLGASIHPQLLGPFPNSRAFDLVLNKHRSKYSGHDLFDIRDLVRDWIADYCYIGLEEILRACQELEILN